MSEFYTAASQKDPLMEWPWVQGPQWALRRGDRGTGESLRQIQQDHVRHRFAVSSLGVKPFPAWGLSQTVAGGIGSGSASNSVPQFLYL